MIYLDNCATTKPDPDIITSFIEYSEVYGNPSSQHKMGQDARDLLVESRTSILNKLGVPSWNLVFTGGGSEANSIVKYSAQENYGHLFCSSVEHSSLYTEKNELPVNPNCCLDMNKLEDVFKAVPFAFVSVMLVNNETGSFLFESGEMKTLKNKYNFLLHSDIVQGLGKTSKINDVMEISDLVTISGHKIHGHKGIGALIFSENEDIDLCPLIPTTQHHEMGLRPGTENMFGIFSLMKAVSSLNANAFEEKSLKIRNEFEKELQGIASPVCNNRAAHISCLSFSDVKDSEVFIEILSAKGLCASSKSACTSGLPVKSRVLTKMFGENATELDSTIRFSFSKYTTMEDIAKAVDIIKDSLKEYECLRK